MTEVHGLWAAGQHDNQTALEDIRRGSWPRILMGVGRQSMASLPFDKDKRKETQE